MVGHYFQLVVRHSARVTSLDINGEKLRGGEQRSSGTWARSRLRDVRSFTTWSLTMRNIYLIVGTLHQHISAISAQTIKQSNMKK